MSVKLPQFPGKIWDGLSKGRADRFQDKSPDHNDWDQLVAEVIAMQGGSAQGTVSGGTVAEGGGTVHQTVITLAAFQALVAGVGVGDVGSKIYDFPTGLISILGAVMDLTITASGGQISSTASVVASIGSVTAAHDATLTSTEADIVPSTAYTLVASVKHAVGLGVTPKIFDGTGTPASAYLNIAVPDADRSDTSENLSVSGTIKITWVNLS